MSMEDRDQDKIEAQPRVSERFPGVFDFWRPQKPLQIIMTVQSQHLPPNIELSVRRGPMSIHVAILHVALTVSQSLQYIPSCNGCR